MIVRHHLPIEHRIETLNTVLILRPLQESDSFDEMTALLHIAYKPLADMGLRFLATHQDSITTQERCLSGYTFVAEQDQALVGTITLYPQSTASDCHYYQREGVWHFGQFAVHPSLQKHGIGSIMMEIAENIAQLNGANELALDTSEHAHHLRAYYEKMGYEFREYVQWDITNYRSIIASKVLDTSSDRIV